MAGTWTSERARLASLSRSRTPDDPDLIAARRNLRAARLEDYIRRTVAAAPPLSDEQRDRLAVLLRGEPPGRRPPSASGGTTCAETADRSRPKTLSPDRGRAA